MLLLCIARSAAPQVDGVLEEQRALQREAIQSQQRVDELDDEARALLGEYRAQLQRLDDLESYNANLSQMLASQAREVADLNASLSEVEVVRREIVPLQQEMLSVLEEFVALDQPILRRERASRIENLRQVLSRADVEIAEKFRRLIEAYQIEAEYGQTTEAYEAPLIGDESRTVEYLRLGRAALYYITLDRKEAALWDLREGAWRPLPAAAIDGLDLAVRMSRRQAPPDLVRLPLFAPEEN